MKLAPITAEQNAIMMEILDTCIEQSLEVEIPIEHFVHSGVYYRTCKVPKGAAIMGAYIQIPTTVIVSGDCLVNIGESAERLTGYHVLKAPAGRRQAFKALEDTYITMCLETPHTDVKDCEKQFTPEWILLTTNRELLMKVEAKREELRKR